MGILNANEAALLIAILYKKYITPEQAFRLYDTGKCKPRRRIVDKVREMIQHRQDGFSWSDIAEMMGMKNAENALTYFCKKKHLIEGAD